MRILYSSLGKFSALAKQFRKLANNELAVRYELSLADTRKCLARLSGYQSDFEIKQSLVKPESATLLPLIDLEAQSELIVRARESLQGITDNQIRSILRRLFGVVTHRLMIDVSKRYSLIGDKGYLRQHCAGEFSASLDGKKGPVTDKNIIHFVVGDVDANLSYAESHPAYNCPSVYEFLLRAWSDREGDLFSGLPKRLLIHRSLEQYFDNNIYTLLTDLDIDLEVSGPNSRKGVRLVGDLDKDIDHEISIAFERNHLERDYKFHLKPDLFIAANLGSTISRARMQFQIFRHTFSSHGDSTKPLLSAPPANSKLAPYIARLSQANAKPFNEFLDIKNIVFIVSNKSDSGITAALLRDNEWRLLFSREIEHLNAAFELELSEGYFFPLRAINNMREHRGFIHPAIHLDEYRIWRLYEVDIVINSLPNAFVFGKDRLPLSAGTDPAVYDLLWVFIDSLLQGSFLTPIVTSKTDIKTESDRKRLEEQKLAIYFLILLYLLDPEEFFECPGIDLDVDMTPLLEFVDQLSEELPRFSALEAKEVMAALDCPFDNVEPCYGSLESVVDRGVNFCRGNKIFAFSEDHDQAEIDAEVMPIFSGDNTKRLH